MADRDFAAAFEAVRPNLMGLAYRILGSRADAEDAVQDAYLKWQHADHGAIDNPSAWLTTVCTRRCLDLLRAAHRARVDYVGAWLPEPIHTPIEDKLDLASSLTTAFLLMLERLTPTARAAYLLHDIFDLSYPEVAATLEIKQDACRKLVSRARTDIEKAKVRHITPLARQDKLLAAFRKAITSGKPTELAQLMSEDIRISADGGGKVPTVMSALSGRDEVLAFLTDKLREWWADYQWESADINRARGFVLSRNQKTVGIVTFDYDEAGKAREIFIMRNPDKLIDIRKDVTL